MKPFTLTDDQIRAWRDGEPSKLTHFHVEGCLDYEVAMMLRRLFLNQPIQDHRQMLQEVQEWLRVSKIPMRASWDGQTTILLEAL